MKASLVLAQIMEAPLSLRTTSRLPRAGSDPCRMRGASLPREGVATSVYGWHSIILCSLRSLRQTSGIEMLAHGSGGPNPAPGSFLNCWVVLGKARPSLGSRHDNVFSLASWVGILENPSLFG